MKARSERQREVAFWKKVYQPSQSECWQWTAGVDWYGYGRFRVGARTLRAHRVAYERIVGPNLTLDHSCRNPGCVNPLHLEPVTMRENTLRGGCPAAINARRTICSRGHSLSGDNLLIARDGRRKCAECRNAYEHMRSHATDDEVRAFMQRREK